MALCKIFDEDEVSILKSNGQFRCGVVLECSEYISSDEDDAADDETSQDRIKKGTVRVAWHPEGTEEILEEKKLTLADRAVMPGDIVRRMVEGHDSQRGFVTMTRVRCHLQTLTKPIVICDVDSSDLLSFSKFEMDPGDVYMDSWVGKIERVVEKYTLCFQDGAKCDATEDDLSMFDDVLDKRDASCEFGSCSYYVGQQLRGDLGSLEHSTWIKSTGQHSTRAVQKHRTREIVVTIENVAIESVDVRWLCRGCATSTDNSTDQLLVPPPTNVKGDDLARLVPLDCFESCGYQLGDKAFYLVRDSDHMVALGANKRYEKPAVLHTFLRQQGLISRNNVQNKSSAENVNRMGAKRGDPDLQSAHVDDDGHPDTKSQANGELDHPAASSEDDEDFHEAEGDGTDKAAFDEAFHLHDDGGNAGTTVSRESLSHVRRRRGTGEAWTGSAGSKVQAKALKKKKRKMTRLKPKPAPSVPLPKPGEKVPVEIIFTQTFVDVVWQDGTVEKNIPAVDVFPIHHLDELEFFPCDFIVSSSDPRYDAASGVVGVIQSVQHTGRTCLVKWIKLDSQTGNDVVLDTEEVSVYDIKEHPDIKYQVGNVVVRVDGTASTASNGSLITDCSTTTSHPAVPVAGQIFTFSTDGQLDVQWADRSRSLCRPYQLYVVSDEMTDDDMTDDDGDDDSEAGESGSYVSSEEWLTEDEEQLTSSDGVDGSAGDSTVTTGPDPATASHSIQILNPEETFASTRAACDKLTDLLQKLQALPQNSSEVKSAVCRSLLAIYRCFRAHDRMLSTSFFGDDSLSQLMAGVRAELSKKRATDTSKKVLKLGESMRSRQKNGPSEATPSDDNNTTTDNTTADNSSNPGLDNGVPAAAVEHVIGVASVPENQTPQVTEAAAMASTSEPENLNHILSEMLRLHGAMMRFMRRTNPAFMKGRDGSAAMTGNDTSVTTAANSNVTSTDGSGNAEGNSQSSDANNPIGSAHSYAANDDIIIVACQRLCEIVAMSESAIETRCVIVRGPELVENHCVIVREPEANSADRLPDSENSISEPAAQPAVEAFNSKLATDTEKSDVGAYNHDDTSTTSAGLLRMDAATMTEISNWSASVPGNKSVGNVDKAAVTSLFNSTATEASGSGSVGSKAEFNPQGLVLVDVVPTGHHYRSTEHSPVDGKTFMNAVYKELHLLQSCLPNGIYIKGFEDRMDLFSVMIQGPARTPYEDGLFFFDVQLPADYPKSPPVFHYISFCKDRLNPNLYEDGKVCVSLLGTWSGKGTEVWNSKSTLLQVVLSIQALILCPEPYYNEAGYERQKGTQLGLENSRMYNEMAILKLVQSMSRMVTNPVSVFEAETCLHMKVYAQRMIRRLEYWLEVLPPVQGSGISLAQTPLTDSRLSLAPSTASTAPPSTVEIPTSSVADVIDSSQKEAALPNADELSPKVDPAATSGGVASSSNILSFPDFPLLPVSQGFKMAMHKALGQFESTLNSSGITISGNCATDQ